MESVQRDTAALEIAEHASPQSKTLNPIYKLLPSKGFCWYCDNAVDNVKRFCGKECSISFAEESELFAAPSAAPGSSQI